jgi:hypothetical protein
VKLLRFSLVFGYPHGAASRLWNSIIKIRKLDHRNPSSHFIWPFCSDSPFCAVHQVHFFSRTDLPLPTRQQHSASRQAQRRSPGDPRSGKSTHLTRPAMQAPTPHYLGPHLTAFPPKSPAKTDRPRRAARRAVLFRIKTPRN